MFWNDPRGEPDCMGIRARAARVSCVGSNPSSATHVLAACGQVTSSLPGSVSTPGRRRKTIITRVKSHEARYLPGIKYNECVRRRHSPTYVLVPTVLSVAVTFIPALSLSQDLLWARLRENDL